MDGDGSADGERRRARRFLPGRYLRLSHAVFRPFCCAEDRCHLGCAASAYAGGSGHYGRYHEAMVTSFYEYLDPLSQPTSISAQVVGPNQFEEISRLDSTNAYSVDPGTAYPYADEWFAAIERSLPHRISLTAQYSWSTLRLNCGICRPDELDARATTGSGPRRPPGNQRRWRLDDHLFESRDRWLARLSDQSGGGVYSTTTISS